MRTYAIAADMPGETEEAASRRTFLADRIRTFFPTCCQPFGALWIVKSDRELGEIRDNLAPYLTEGDKLVVLLTDDACAWRGLAPDAALWLQEQL
ncbi:hypothetical protein [Aureimonas phyllosphaerae]|uniref:Uncharacterized protein n=1 Tax=Aureimonas phyllosphaerae TaxID=1166078 RepID=A0A7W6FVF4_9HYPH|nr:hypothetical protein [Aureimonas phyllosphaerae]MBB3936765.1 hypothetical protein [Aureimonas phyllosphaerae]MBB3960372.1 hypothetical protein [Aureimonas phyllosphaerae]SFF22165.1 hypothetical protein SAMN05216566_10510 [Aureimonas phyllosphaerae]